MEHARLIQVTHQLKETSEKNVTKQTITRLKALVSEASELIDKLGGGT